VIVAVTRGREKCQAEGQDSNDDHTHAAWLRQKTARALDNDGNGKITVREIEEHLGDLRVRADVMLDRLSFERELCQMLAKLPAFIVCLSCFIAALIELSPAASKYDVHRHLKVEFGLESIANVKQIDDIYTFMKTFEKANAKLQATSAQYWCEKRFTETKWDANLMIPVTKCASPRQYVLTLNTDKTTSWSALQSAARRRARRLGGSSGQPAESNGKVVPACVDRDEELKETLSENTTCAAAALDSHHKVCEEGLGLSLCPKTCGFCSPFTYQHKTVYTKPQVTMLPTMVYQTRFAKDSCHGFAEEYEHQPYNPALITMPALDGVREGRVLSCVDRSKPADTEYSHEVDCPEGSPPTVCKDGKRLFSHRHEYHGITIYPKMLSELNRDVEVMNNIEWIDVQTEVVVIGTLVYTENIEMFTSLEVDFSFDTAGNVDGSVVMISYRDIVNDSKATFIACLVINVLGATVIVILSVVHLVRHPQECNRGYVAYELFTRGALMIYPLILIISWAAQVPMSAEFSHLLHSFLDSEGSSPEELDKAYDSYFEVLSHIYSETSWLKRHKAVGFFVLYAQFLQFIFYMNAHPKMAVLTSTVAKCLNNLLHFALLFIVIFLMLAFMAHWMLGEYITEFGQFDTAMYSQMRMFFGEFIKAPEADDLHGMALATYWVYAWTFMLVIWLLLLNFLLAIIVDAFVEVKDSFKNKTYMSDVFSDLFGVTYTSLVGVKRRWPANKRLVEFFQFVVDRSKDRNKPTWMRRITKIQSIQSADEEEENCLTCTPEELMGAFPELKSTEAMASFLLHYLKHSSRAIALSEQAVAEADEKLDSECTDVGEESPPHRINVASCTHALPGPVQ